MCEVLAGAMRRLGIDNEDGERAVLAVLESSDELPD